MQETVTDGRSGNVTGRLVQSGLSAWMRLPSRTRLAIVIFILCLFAYTLLLFLVPRYKGSPTTDGDEPHYLMITESLIRDHDLDVGNNYQQEQYSTYFENEIAVPHITEGRGGREVSTHPAFLSFVILPAFWLFGYRGAAFTMIIFTSLTAAFTFLIADRFASRKIAAALTVFLFFTYPLIFYARLIYPETAALFLLALGVWGTWRLNESGRNVYALLGGISSGLILLLHPKFIALSASLLLLFLLVARRDRTLLKWWLVPVVSCIGLLLLLTGITYGPNLLRGLTASGGSKLVGGYLGTNSFWGIAGMFLDRAWGLFIFAPLYMVFPHGLSLQNNRLEWSRWWVFFPVCIIAHAIVLGVFQSWNGGAAPVQRYLIPIASLLVICVILFVDRCRSRVAWAIAGVLALFQIVTTVWAFRFMIGTYGMEDMDNVFLARFLGPEGPVTRFLLNVFPLFHPAGIKSVVLTIVWIVIFAVTIYLARRYYMTHGGGRLSPIVDIRPFKMVAGSA